METPAADFKDNILQTIGNTPLVKINKLNPNKNTTIYAKVEGFNPTGSIKDRIALSMIQQAEEEGKLTRGKTILSPPPATPEWPGHDRCDQGLWSGDSHERVRLGGEAADDQGVRGTVTLSEGKYGTDGAIRKARELVREYPEKYYAGPVLEPVQQDGPLQDHGG